MKWPIKLVIFTIFLSKMEIKTNKFNKINNGHLITDLEADICIGQTEETIVNKLGQPFKVPGQPDILYYFISERKIYALYPFKGKNVKGKILIIKLDPTQKVKEIINKEYIPYKHTNQIKLRIQQIKEQIKKKEKDIKDFKKNYFEKEKQRIKKIEGTKKMNKEKKVEKNKN